jgi:ABC-type transporter Mla subunit MlaD
MNTKDKAIRDAFEAAQADLAHLRERETQIRAKFEKYSRLTSEIQALVADAILKLTEAQRKVDLVSAPALKIELEQVLTELDSKWTSAGERLPS